MTQKLLSEQSQVMPKLQILIYPWLHVYSHQLPSYIKYRFEIIDIRDLALWYLGNNNFTQEMKDAVSLDYIMHALDETTQIRIKNSLNSELIPDKYKIGRTYYDKGYFEQNTQLDDTSKKIFSIDSAFSRKIQTLFRDDISPGLMDDEKLRSMPSTYQIVCEWDCLKDESIIFGERLRQAGVKTQIAYYDTCYHGMVQMLDRYKLPVKMLDDLVEYIKLNVY